MARSDAFFHDNPGVVQPPFTHKRALHDVPAAKTRVVLNPGELYIGGVEKPGPLEGRIGVQQVKRAPAPENDKLCYLAIEHPFKKANHVVTHLFYHQEFFRPAGLSAEQKFLAKSSAGKINHVDLLRQTSVPEGLVPGDCLHKPYVLTTTRHHDFTNIFEEYTVRIRIHIHEVSPFPVIADQ